MKTKIIDLIDFKKVDTLLEGFNKSTGFVTAILDLEGNVLSKSGWRQICTEFHRVNPETSKKCTISDTVLSGKMEEGEKYHFYQCLNGLIDVAVPIEIKGEHIANLFSGQFFFEEPDLSVFKKQAEKYGFNQDIYLKALGKVPVVSKEKVLVAMDFLLNMTQLISDMTFQKLEQMELNEVIKKNERILRLFVEHSPASIAMFDNNMRYLVASHRFLLDYNLGNQDVIGRSHYEVFPDISERWKEIHRRCLAGETISESNDPFPRADGSTDWVRWEIRPWYESENQIGGIILFSEVITSQIEGREALKESEKYNRMLFEQSAIGLALTTFDGRLVDINTTFATIIGRTIEEAKALTYWDITPEKYQKKEQLQLESLEKIGRYGPYEKEYIHKDGHLVPVRLQGLIIERNNEKLIWSSVEDISEQKKAEQDLIAAKEEIEASEHFKTDLLIKYDEAQQSAKIGNWDWDMVTNKVWWSDELYRIFDLDPNSFVPSVESNAKFVHPDDNGPYHQNVQRVIENKEELNAELRIISGNGILKHCNSRAKLEFNEAGNPVRFYGTFADITERKKAELDLARLFESEKAALIEANQAKEQLSQILERISDGFGSLDRDWHYIFVNEKLAQNVGKKREELLGQNIWEVFPQAIGTPVHKAYLRAMEEQVVIDLEHFYPPFAKWFQHRFYPSPDGISVFSKDITEHKLAEEKLKESSSLIRIAAEKAKLGGWNVDLKENRSYWSDEVATIHEMPPGFAPLVEDGINFYAPEWRDRITKVFTECAVNGVPYDEEMEIITSTGKRVWIRTIGEPVRDENGQIFKVQGAFQDISEKKIVEEKSREKDLQFRKLSANVPDLIFQFTRKPDGTYCVPVASEGIKNIFGCSPDDVVDDFTPIGKVIYPEDAERVIADIENSAKNLTQFTCEFRVQIPGKPVQWILSRSTPEKLPDGNITWYGFNTDITQRKEFEDALRESEGKFRKIYEEGPFGMALVNSDYKFIMANRTFCEIIGYTESELRELTFRDITFSEDKEIGIESIKKLIKGEIPVFKSEKRYVRKDGRVIWVAITVAANFDKCGNFLYNVAIVEDISRRKQADEKINTLNERLQLLVEAIQELSISTSMENIMATVRTSARKLVNADGSTFILRDGDSCFYADEDTVSPLWKGQRFQLTNCISGWAMLNKQPVIIEDIYADERVPIEAYKSTFVKSLAIAPIRLNDPLGAIGAYWGSNYLPSEIEIKLLNTLADAAAKAVENVQLIDGLEQKIIERTSQLQSVNKELETFTYSVSHDLKAPLRGIDGYSKLLSDLYANELNDEAKNFISTIRKSTQLMSQLIDDLLQYSRLERSQMRNETVMIKSFIDAILKINEDEIISHRFSVITDIPEASITADYNGIQMALRNLIENAIKFTKTVPEPTIEIKQKESERCWTISVKDNGIGFDMKYSQRIFEIFQRLHRVEDYPGTGIGLAMVAKAMQRMNGRAWAESTPGLGATFYLEIPKPI
ncbi:MAG: PAS domain S-box protein [Bacteroidales bacterium]